MAKLSSYKTVQIVDGKSMVPLLKNPDRSDSVRSLIWHLPNKWQPLDGHYQSAIRQGRWKLIYQMRDGKKELYDLSNDIGEQHNIAEQHPEKVKVLAALLGNQLRAWNSPMPRYKNSGNVVPMPDEKN